MRYCMFRQQNLLLVLPQLLRNLVQVNYAVVYRLLVAIVLRYPQPLGYRLQTFFQMPHFQRRVRHAYDTVVDLVGSRR